MIQRKAARKRQSGQSLIEYAMALLIMVSAYKLVDFQLRKNIGKIWLAMAKDIAPGCPGCEAPDQLK